MKTRSKEKHKTKTNPQVKDTAKTNTQHRGLTHGSFMRMNTRAMKKLSSTLTKPMKSSRKRLSLGMLGALERSRMMKPKPPMVKRKLEARPSMMYWPFTLCKDHDTHTTMNHRSKFC